MKNELIDNIYDFLENKIILILGFGKEGKSTYKFIRDRFKDVKLTILDYNVVENIEDENTEIICDSEDVKYFDRFDVIIKSPGVPIKKDVYEKYKEKITSQTNLFLEYSKNNVIGITGTKGKSTTSSLIYHILKNCNLDCVFVGNIGIPIFSEINNIKEDTIVVVEMSSHQIQYLTKSPNIAVLLNIYEEHLDYYESFEEYILAKEKVYEFQNESDLLIYNGCSKNININKILNHKQRKLPIYFNLENENIKINNYINIKEDEIVFVYNNIENIINKKNLITTLKGEHNIYNIAVAIGVCFEIGLKQEEILKEISSFKGLENRIEFIGRYSDIDFYNDSIATIPESTICTIKSFEKVNTVIIGGKDRGVNYSELVDFLTKSYIDNVLLIGESGEKIYKMLDKNNKSDEKNDKYIYAKDLENAVKLAKINTLKNGICILSPAAASYGYYKNFEERGKVFKELVKK